MQKLKIKEVLIVEGKYDKNKLSQLIDGIIIQTDGFGIFKDEKKKQMIKSLAKDRGIIILTDSDSAGFTIRNHIKSFVDSANIKNAYIPDIFGKEKRKSRPSKEGKLGVEGVPDELIIKALKDTDPHFDNGSCDPVTPADLFDLGLIGEGSSLKRAELIDSLGLPEHISTKALIQFLNTKMTRSEFFEKYTGIR